MLTARKLLVAKLRDVESRQGYEPVARGMTAALLLVRVIETETGVSWAAAREVLEDLALVTLEGKDGRFELLSTLTAEQRNLLNRLDLPPPKPRRRTPSSPQSHLRQRPLLSS